MPGDCLFCDIAQGDEAAEYVFEGERVIAFRDKYPKAPVHVLVVSREHIPSAHHLEGQHADLLAESFQVAQRIAEREETADGYRIATNIGQGGGQAIPHLHFHVIGGTQLGDIA